jgi:membrane protein implicated in regulation of membrane protease activity
VERAYLASTRVLNAMLLVLGVAMVVVALAGGGGALALGVVLGILLALLGAGRLYLARPRPSAGRPDSEQAAESTRGTDR